MINERELILDILLEVSKGEYLNLILKNVLDKYAYLPVHSRSFIKYVCAGVTQHRIALDYMINLKSKVKVNKMKPLVRELLRMSVYQLKFMTSVPSSAAINEAVKLAKKRKFVNLSGFINGVLRSIDRDKDIALESIDDVAVKYSMPQWIMESFEKWYGKDKAISMAAASVEKSPLTARVCKDKISVKELVEKLKAQGIMAEGCPDIDCGIILHDVNSLTDISYFEEGYFTIQDISSQLTGIVAVNAVKEVLPNMDGCFVADLCAAPGGKSLHVAEGLGEKAQVEARDLTENKLWRIEENIARLKRSNVKTRVSDATIFDSSLASRCDLVIADVPCSGLGVLSRKSDLKYRVMPQDLISLENLQRRIIDNAVKYLKPGGLLLYSTCTVNPGENIKQYQYILEKTDMEAVDIGKLLPETIKAGVETEGCVQLLQGLNPGDGFFISLAKRKG